VVEILADGFQTGSSIRAMHRVELLLREIEHRFRERAQLDQPRSERVDRGGKFSAEGAQRGARRLLARGLDQVGHRLGLRQVELALEERAPRELAWLGEPRT